MKKELRNLEVMDNNEEMHYLSDDEIDKIITIFKKHLIRVAKNIKEVVADKESDTGIVLDTFEAINESIDEELNEYLS